MVKLLKETKERIKKLINNNFVNNYHKALLKGILNNSDKNNLSKADTEILPLILKEYSFIQ